MNGQIGSYPRGIAATAAVDPDRIALIDGSRRLTFGELDALANGIADRLAEHGVAAGDAVGILLHNRAEWFMISHAIARLGAMYVPISPRLTPSEAAYIVDRLVDEGVFHRGRRSPSTASASRRSTSTRRVSK